LGNIVNEYFLTKDVLSGILPKKHRRKNMPLDTQEWDNIIFSYVFYPLLALILLSFFVSFFLSDPHVCQIINYIIKGAVTVLFVVFLDMAIGSLYE
jgi:hypothetical protein